MRVGLASLQQSWKWKIEGFPKRKVVFGAFLPGGQREPHRNPTFLGFPNQPQRHPCSLFAFHQTPRIPPFPPCSLRFLNRKGPKGFHLVSAGRWTKRRNCFLSPCLCEVGKQNASCKAILLDRCSLEDLNFIVGGVLLPSMGVVPEEQNLPIPSCQLPSDCWRERLLEDTSRRIKTAGGLPIFSPRSFDGLAHMRSHPPFWILNPRWMKPN